MSLNDLNNLDHNSNTHSEKNLNPWKIIIADDEPEIHALTQMVLEEYSFEDRKFEFISAYSGEQTINILEKNPDAALILLDVVMERENSGLIIVKYIREKMKNPNIRIILRTGQPGQAPAEKVILGYDINDYKEKTELTAQKLLTAVIASVRAYSHILAISNLNHELENKVQERTLKLKLANEQLSNANSHIKKELEMAKKIQEAIIPKTFPENKMLDFNGSYQAMEELGGDFYDVFKISEHKLAIVIADVSGHGIPAAFITTIAKMAFMNYSNASIGTSKVTEEVNDQICITMNDLGYYLTAFYAIIDIEQGIMEYTNAGHNGAFLLHNNKEIEVLETKSTCIGLFYHQNYHYKKIQLKKGDKLILFTDGIPDTRNKKGQFFGIKNFENILTQNYNLSAKELVEKVMLEVENFSESLLQEDDRTILVADIISDSGNMEIGASSKKK